MGSSSSKVGRALPTKTRVSGGGAKGSENLAQAHPVSRSRPMARETKDQDIDRDGKDPQLLTNLGRIGQVNIPTMAGTVSKTNQVSEVYRTRDLAEQQATSAKPTRNRLLAGSLSTMLDDQKFVTSQLDMEQLAARYTLDVSVLQRLSRFVNSPSIGEGTVVRSLGEDGQEKITMQAIWTEPDLNDVSKQT